jgi:hypothetical protein
LYSRFEPCQIHAKVSLTKPKPANGVCDCPPRVGERKGQNVQLLFTHRRTIRDLFYWSHLPGQSGRGVSRTQPLGRYALLEREAREPQHQGLPHPRNRSHRQAVACVIPHPPTLESLRSPIKARHQSPDNRLAWCPLSRGAVSASLVRARSK